MRIVGGKFAGRTLTSPNDFRVRPTAEAVRVGTMGLIKADLEKARVIDLFAGTGALGLEAISRGARYADFVETGPASLHALKANIAALRVREKTRVFKKDALPFAGALEPDRYDIAFLDPPYGSRMLDRVIESWVARGFARVLVAEYATGHAMPADAEPFVFDKRIFGDSSVTIYRLPPVVEAQPASASRRITAHDSSGFDRHIGRTCAAEQVAQ
jgi:16S rRNA (guanine966-N2)-methyltransferase